MSDKAAEPTDQEVLMRFQRWTLAMDGETANELWDDIEWLRLAMRAAYPSEIEASTMPEGKHCACKFSGGGVLSKQCEFHTRLHELNDRELKVAQVRIAALEADLKMAQHVIGEKKVQIANLESALAEAQRDVPVWFVERENQSRPAVEFNRWFSGFHYEDAAWTNDPHEAIWFTRKEDAEKFTTGIEQPYGLAGLSLKVTDHLFIAALKAQGENRG